MDAKRLVEDGTLTGSMFETFAVTEMVRQATAGDLAPELTFTTTAISPAMRWTCSSNVRTGICWA